MKGSEHSCIICKLNAMQIACTHMQGQADMLCCNTLKSCRWAQTSTVVAVAAAHIDHARQRVLGAIQRRLAPEAK